MARASKRDLAELASGKGSARDRREAGRSKRKKRSKVPARFKMRKIKGR